MIPSANSGGDLTATWHSTESWAAHQAAASANSYNSGCVSNSAAGASGGDHARYLTLHSHQVPDWENAMLLAHQSNSTPPTHNNHESAYDQAAAYSKAAAGISSMQAEAFASLSQPRHYEELLSAHMASTHTARTFSNNVNAWGLLNTVCARSSGSTLEREASLLQSPDGTQYNYGSLNGADVLGYSSLAGAAGGPATNGFYGHSSRSNRTGFDQRRLDDIMKQSGLYTTHDLTSARLGLNLGGRTYFSADDYAFGRWGKRLRPNSPAGCVSMQPAPLCQAEGCKADLSMAKHYHRRHKVCEYHSKAATVQIGDQTQRFCQQCSRFHVLGEFDDGKRSCRKRLADHNRRRRKPQPVQTQLAAADTAAPTIDGGGSTADNQHQPKDELLSQEVTTGSESTHTGAMLCSSNKGSPAAPPTDQDCESLIKPPTESPAASATPTILNMQRDIDQERNRLIEEKVKLEYHTDIISQQGVDASPGAGHHVKGLLIPADHGHGSVVLSPADNLSIAESSPVGSSHLVATLPLMDPDLQPHNSLLATSILENSTTTHLDRPAGPFDSSARLVHPNKAVLTMPWLQGSSEKNKSEQMQLQVSLACGHGNADFDEESPDGCRRSWMWMKGSMPAAAAEESSACAASNESRGGPQELLRLLGDNRDHEQLLSMSRCNKQSSVSRAHVMDNGDNALTFMDHSMITQHAFQAAAQPAQERLHHLPFSADAADKNQGLLNRFA